MDDETNQAHREDLREYGAHQCSACVLWSNKSKGNQSFEQTFLLLLRLLLLISLPPYPFLSLPISLSPNLISLPPHLPPSLYFLLPHAELRQR
jgi:hypothetical protein